MVQKIERPNADFELGYWGIRGLAQPIRFLLVHADVTFSEVRFGINQDGTAVNDESLDWQTYKSTLEMPFPNLPYIIEKTGSGDIKLSQSNSIMRYLARRFDYYGDTDSDQTSIDILQDEAYDFRNAIIDTVYTLGVEYQATYDNFKATTAPKYLDGFEKYLLAHEEHSHFVGSRLSLVDFILYELICQISVMIKGSVTDSCHPSLFSFINAFRQLPRINEYMGREEYIDRPINSRWASFS